jgi:phosphate/sulfate permease
MIFLVFVTYRKPYKDSMNNLFAVTCQVTLFATLMCGLLVKLEVPIAGTVYDIELESEIISWIVISIVSLTMAFGLFALVREAALSQDAWRKEADRQKAHTAMAQESARRLLKRQNTQHALLASAAMTGDDEEAGDAEAEEEGWIAEEGVQLKQLTHEQEELVIRVFVDADDNGSGTIEDDELENIGYELGEPLSMAELLMVFTLLDHNSDGSIEFRHFTDWWRNRLPQPKDGMGSSVAVVMVDTESDVLSVVASVVSAEDAAVEALRPSEPPPLVGEAVEDAERDPTATTSSSSPPKKKKRVKRKKSSKKVAPAPLAEEPALTPVVVDGPAIDPSAVKEAHELPGPPTVDSGEAV